jgi:hypothetical protein
MTKQVLRVVLAATLLAAGYVAGRVSGGEQMMQAAQASDSGKVYEIRTYTANEGKLDNVLARFRDHTVRIFNNHGMKSIGYWTPTDPPLSQTTLIYILEHPSREAAAAAWKAFGSDPEWMKVKGESEAQGKIVAKAESTFVKATDFSPIK